MKLEEFIKQDILAFLDEFSHPEEKKNAAAAEDTSFLLNDFKNEKQANKNSSVIHQEQEEADNEEENDDAFEKIEMQPLEEDVSMDFDFFPSESDTINYEEPSALRTTTVDAPKEVIQQFQNRSTNNSQQQPSSQGIDRSQIKLLVEEELRAKMSQLQSQVPSQERVMQSSQKEDILRLKNEIIDLKSIVKELQKEKYLASQEREQLKDELKKTEIEAEIAKKETKRAYQEITGKNNSQSKILSHIHFNQEHSQQNQPTNTSDSQNNSPFEDENNLMNTFTHTSPQEINQTKKIQEESHQASSQIKEEQESSKEKKALILPRSKELPEVLLIEERLHELKDLLSQKNYSEAKNIYEEVRKRAIQLKEHDEEKKSIYEHLENAAKILSLALKGSVHSISKDKKSFVNTSTKKPVLIQKNEQEELSQESMNTYVQALEAMKKKEKARSLRLLIELADKYPRHLGIKLRLQQALAL